MRIALSTLAAFVLFAASGFSAEIKATTRLTVTSTALAQPIEITDAAVLALSNVFAGRFIGTPTSVPSESLTCYTVTFDIQTLQGVKSAAYVVAYCLGHTTDEEFIYLPGRGDAPHRRNISTILREGQDGLWHRAADEWSDAIRPFLNQ